MGGWVEGVDITWGYKQATWVLVYGAKGGNCVSGLTYSV